MNQHPTKRSIEFASGNSKDDENEPSIKLDVGEKEGSEFVEYELNEIDDDKEDLSKKIEREEPKT